MKVTELLKMCDTKWSNLTPFKIVIGANSFEVVDNDKTCIWISNDKIAGPISEIQEKLDILYQEVKSKNKTKWEL